MRKSLKAALLSALVFPGAGHFLLKKPVQGILLSGMAVICLYFLLTAVVKIAQELSIKIQSGEVPLDIAKINELVSHQLAESDSHLVNIPSILLVIFWIIGVVDSFRIGHSQGTIDDDSSKKT